MTTIGKITMIFKRSELSISKFASIINKDRRTVTSWIDGTTQKDPTKDVLNKISTFFRYPESVWDIECKEEFTTLIQTVPKEEIRLIDEGYLGGLKYILKNEDKERLVIHAQFPGSMYRDTTVPKVYKKQDAQQIEGFKQERISKMLHYSFKTTEWYSIKTVLNFCFSPIGNFYTKEQKIQILSLMHDTFDENYNKQLHLFDSYSQKIYGLDTMYTSINIKAGIVFFKAPLESVFIEVTNAAIVERLHKHFTSGKEAPIHVAPSDATKILGILKSAIENDKSLEWSYEEINKKTFYGKLFKNNISMSLQHKLSRPREL